MSQWIELLGYAASSAVFATFSVSEMVSLRCLAIASNVLFMAYGFIEHSGEHYGQLAVYYRLSGLVPPESRPKK